MQPSGLPESDQRVEFHRLYEALRSDERRNALMALVLAATLILMLIGDRIIGLIGRSGASILSQVMGILSAVAVQMVYSAFHGELGPG